MAIRFCTSFLEITFWVHLWTDFLICLNHVQPWEESMREAEKKGTVVLLQNLDRTYTSDEVEV